MSQRTPEECFWSKVNKTECCWEWMGALHKNGYGRLQCGTRRVQAHRFSYSILIGNPGKLHITHKCGNQRCVNPTHLQLKNETDLERFWSKVNKTEYCWEWAGYIGTTGYGQFTVKSRFVAAHRYSYLITKGEPGNLSVLHHCDNPKCVNPEHLFLGTQAENVIDCANKDRRLKGSQDGNAKLTEETVVAIRESYAKGGISQRALARQYGVVQGSIQYVLSRQTWKHV